MGLSLVLGGELHIVPIGLLKVFLVAYHGFVCVSLKDDVHRAFDAFASETAFYRWAHFGHVTNGVGLFLVPLQ